MKQLDKKYEDIISIENLLAAWQEFIVAKNKRLDVQMFGRHLMDNIVSLHKELSSKTYRHGPYESFRICDPKPRHIHKASVRDRLVHHAISGSPRCAEFDEAQNDAADYRTSD